eukprot:13923079-Heterocapsa_arctica.AAC.1
MRLRWVACESGATESVLQGSTGGKRVPGVPRRCAFGRRRRISVPRGTTFRRERWQWQLR